MKSLSNIQKFNTKYAFSTDMAVHYTKECMVDEICMQKITWVTKYLNYRGSESIMNLCIFVCWYNAS